MPADRQSRIRGIAIGGESLQIGMAGFVAPRWGGVAADGIAGFVTSLWDRSLIAGAAMFAWSCKGFTYDSI
jgi:hypothetical protein